MPVETMSSSQLKYIHHLLVALGEGAEKVGAEADNIAMREAAVWLKELKAAFFTGRNLGVCESFEMEDETADQKKRR